MTSDPISYRLEITTEAKADLKKLSKDAAERIVRKLLWVAENMESVDHEALKGQWSGLFRWRVGDYRAIYAIDHELRLISLVAAGHRRDVYDD